MFHVKHYMERKNKYVKCFHDVSRETFINADAGYGRSIQMFHVKHFGNNARKTGHIAYTYI